MKIRQTSLLLFKQLKYFTHKSITFSISFATFFLSPLSASETSQVDAISESLRSLNPRALARHKTSNSTDPSDALAIEGLRLCMKELQELEQKDLLDGQVLIARGDKWIFSVQSEEIADTEKEPQFMIASLSKQFFAAAFLKILCDHSSDLTEEGKIIYVKSQLALPLSHFLPPEATIWNGHFPQWAEAITPHRLLSHTSGLPNYTETNKYRGDLNVGKKFFELPHSKAEIIDLIIEGPLLFTPGDKYSYCNTGYVLIAELIEILSGMPAHAYLEQNIFEPLNLASTFCPEEGTASTLQEHPRLSGLVSQWNYDLTGAIEGLYPLQHNENIINAIGSGSLVSSASDLLKWNLALHKDHSILPKPLYQLMMNPNIEGYGYGIGVAISNSGTVYRHRGEIDTFRSRLDYLPQQDLSIIVLTNTNFDWHKLYEKNKQILSSLDKSLKQEEKEKLASELLLEKYPDERSFNSIVHIIEKNFSIQFINE